MISEDPHRWLETIQNRREYVQDQLKAGTPVFAASLEAGILMFGVGAGQSKVFEIHDRQAMAGLGHPSDMESVRQQAIDKAHVESFARSSEDVSLRRLVSYGLSPLLKSNFEHILQPPHLVELLFAEVGLKPADDRLYRLHYDGQFEPKTGIAAAFANADVERKAERWLRDQIQASSTLEAAADLLAQAWWLTMQWSRRLEEADKEETPSLEQRRLGFRESVEDRAIEVAVLSRDLGLRARHRILDAKELGL